MGKLEIKDVFFSHHLFVVFNFVLISVRVDDTHILCSFETESLQIAQTGFELSCLSLPFAAITAQ